MATYRAASFFTWNEIKEAHLTWAEAQALSDENFIKLMQVKLNRFSPQTPEQAENKDILIRLAKNLAFALTCDVLKFAAKECVLTLWKAILSLTQQ